MTKTITFNSGNQFVAHVLPEPTEGPVPELNQSSRRLTDQSTALRAEQDQAKATVSAATQQIADMAVAGKSGKAIGDVLAEAGHARALIATLDEQLDIVYKADSILSRKLFNLQRSDPDWKQYLSDCNRWRCAYNDALRVIRKQHSDTAIQPADASGDMKKKEARLEADRLNLERWQEWSADLADEMIFKFERENEPATEDGTKRRRLSRS